MDVLLSLQSLSSVAIWPVLMMNWRSILAYFPAIEGFANELNVDVLIHMVLGTRIGLSALGILSILALAHLTYSAWKAGRRMALIRFYTKISMSQNSMMFDQVVDWMTRNRSKFHYVHTGQISFRRVSENVQISDSEENIDIGRLMNEIPPEFQPEINEVRFWLGGSYFWMQERKEKKLEFHGREAPDNWLDIFCFNWKRSTEPLRDLLVHILKDDAAHNCKKTRIYIPEAPWHQFSQKSHWGLSKSRLRRPLSTVILDQQQKEMIIEDIRNFLTRSGVAWYQEKGLPLRLGYLFSGPPGTGKSSLAFALAGNFGLSVYMINLSAPGLSDSDIETLFSRLPRHGIVLLEDVDATQPLSRDLPKDKTKVADSQDDADADASASEDGLDSPVPPPPLPPPGLGRRGQRSGTKQRDNTVTLSGLLNAIDGVAASEGRILIMTTNHIENLDEALIRTGRADRIVTFTNATKKQAEDMFNNAYTGTRWGQHMSREVRLKHPEMEEWTDDEIHELAKEFSEKIHDVAFSPALIQQYFKDFRAEPRRAVSELDEWMKDPRGYRKPSLNQDTDALILELKAKKKQSSQERPDTPPATPRD